MECTIGVVGLGVMGSSLALNMAGHGFSVAAYDVHPHKSAALAEQAAAGGLAIHTTDAPNTLMALLEKPRRVLLMVPAGQAVDSVIAQLKKQTTPGDILIDGGNSWFLDTERRGRELAAEQLHLIGAGISGGEEGALKGPSIMPGGPRDGYDTVAPVLGAIAARATDGEPCVAYLGPGGAGHYVKMVHNGIEYGDMQLIAETYDLLHRGLGLSLAELHDLFVEWNTQELQSYLVEITAAIFARQDPDTGRPLLDVIEDEAAQKGTGKWTSQNALDVGAPIPTIDAAVHSRIVSALKSERVQASRVLTGPSHAFAGNREQVISAARDALYASKVTSYAQGMNLLRLASAEYKYGVNPGEVAKIWRAGCIIRATLLEDIMQAYRSNPNLVNLLVDPVFADAVGRRQAAWRLTVRTAVELGIPVPATSASLAYFDAYRTARLPANLTQAQRDYFGAHTYQRVDRAGVFHTNWTEPY